MKEFSQKNIKVFALKTFTLVQFDYEGKRLFTYGGLNAFQIVEELLSGRILEKQKVLICSHDAFRVNSNKYEDFLPYKDQDFKFKNLLKEVA